MKSNLQKLWFLTLLLIIVTLPENVNAKNPISWQPEAITKIIFPDVPVEQNVSFVSDVSLGNVTLFVVPELRPYLTIQPSSINVVAGQTYNFNLMFSAPLGTKEDTISGTIHVRTGNRTRPQTLKVDIIIGGNTIMQSAVFTNSTAVDNFTNWETMYGTSLAREMLLDWLLVQSDVENAGLSEDNETIWINYRGGLPAIIPTSPPDALGNPSNQTAAIISPIYDDPVEPGHLECDYMIESLQGSCISGSVLQKNQDVTLEFLKQLHNYGVISIWCHGAMYLNQVVLITGEQVNSIPFIGSPNYLDWLAYPAKIIVAGKYWAITPQFIRHYATSPYPQSLVAISACKSLQNSSMAGAFIESGAATYFGWQNTVSPGFALNKKINLFASLINEQKTTGEAFLSLTDRIDESQNPPGVFYMYGNTDLTLCPPQTNDFWQLINSIPIDSKIYAVESNTAGDVFLGGAFLDQSIGGWRGTIFKSTNNGIDWNLLLMDPNVNSFHQIIINGTGKIFVLADFGILYASTNNGISWTLVNTGFIINSIAKSLSNDLFAISSNSSLYKSTNDGLSWNLINPDIGFTLINCLGVAPNGYLYSGTFGNGAYRSTNGGLNWTLLANGMTSGARVFKFNNLGYIFAGVDFANTGDPNGVFRSTDNGETWLRWNRGWIPVYTGMAINQLGYIFVGTLHQGVFRSNDNGDNWTQINSGLINLNDAVLSICITPSGYAFAGTLNGGLYRSVNSTFLLKDYQNNNDSKVNKPNAFLLNQNYPNPFNPITRIKYDLPDNNYVSLKIFDLLGQEIIILVNEVKSAGSYEIEFDGSSLPSGVYIYRLQAGSLVETKKMVLMK